MSENGSVAAPAASARVDRRVRRTRHALRHALLELILEKGYDRVTVEEIIERADVGRSTFYAHFRDKEDLFLSSFEEEIRQAFSANSTEAEPGSPEASPSLLIFRHAAAHADLYKALVKRRGGWPLVRRHLEQVLTDLYEERLGPASHDGVVPARAAATFLANGLLGILTWWLDADTPIGAKDLDEVFRKLSTWTASIPDDGSEGHRSLWIRRGLDRI
jgi:AcrR family transcriptional regulator